MLDKWKKIIRNKKIFSIITIGIIFACLISASYASNLEDLKLPDDLKEDTRTSIYKHTLFGDIMELHSSSNNETVKQYGDVKLRIQQYDKDSTPEPVKVSDDPFYKYNSNTGYWELVEINGEKYQVGISNSQSSLQDSGFAPYCLDKLKEFNKLNDAKIIEA